MNNFVLKRNDKCQFLIGTVFILKSYLNDARIPSNMCQFLIGTVFSQKKLSIFWLYK